MATPCTVTGNMQTLSAGAIPQGTILFQLTNIGIGNPIRVVGTALFPAITFVVQSASNGSFTTQLWGNDNIDPANTLYQVTFRDSSGNEIGPILYSITGTVVNLDNLAATSTVLPPVLFSIPNSARFTASGTSLTSGDFTLTGWGGGATITAIHGSDMAHRFTITAGTAPSISPTVELTFHDGTWMDAPVVIANMSGGTGSVSDLGLTQTATTYTLTYEGLPIATQTYIIDVICIGVLN
jgi:hypothetical protein